MRARSFTVLVTLVAAFVVATVTLTAQASKVDVTGKWMFNVETAAGSGTPTITLKQDGDKLTGHYTGQLGDVDLTGSVKGSDFQFSFSSDLQGNRLDVTYKGTIESKDALKGTVSIAGLGEGTFTAKRQ
jgi:phosphatidylserine decarboxylase